MPSWIAASIPVFLASIFAAIGALFLELRDHRDRLVRIETELQFVKWMGKEDDHAGGA
jgi:predicted outer membrane lipoprotein